LLKIDLINLPFGCTSLHAGITAGEYFTPLSASSFPPHGVETERKLVMEGKTLPKVTIKDRTTSPPMLWAVMYSFLNLYCL
jgi:hypothetical protein